MLLGTELYTVENRSLNNTTILRFDQRNPFHVACSTLHRKTENLSFNDSWWIQNCRRRSRPYFITWSNLTKYTNKTISNYDVVKLPKIWSFCTRHFWQSLKAYNLQIFYSIQWSLFCGPFISQSHLASRPP